MIPVASDLKSSPLTHRLGDCFNPPALTNFLGVVQAGMDLTGLRSLSFPPFAMADTLSGAFVLDGRHFPSLGVAVTFTWSPDRIIREGAWQGLYLTSFTALATGAMAAVVEVCIENRSGAKRALSVGINVQGRVTRCSSTWGALPPCEDDNMVDVDGGRGAIVFRARHSAAASVQGTYPRADHISSGAVRYAICLRPGEVWRMSYVHAVGETVPSACGVYDALIADVPGAVERARESWDAELKAVFTPRNDRYGGHLPILDTRDDDIRRLYHMGALGVMYFKRDSPYSVMGRTYDTLLPRYWQSVTFIWDYFLSMRVHAMLDPGVMRRYLEHWIRTGIHSHFGTEYLTGGPVGYWYSVNDYAMVSMVREYVQWTGDRAWLSEPVAGTGKRVIEHVVEFARQWERFRTVRGLADYGGINNLLECVSTYTHEVASLNVAAVHVMRVAADLVEFTGENGALSRGLRGEAEVLLQAAQELYVDGKGYWRALRQDGASVEVRHCYDLLTVLNTIPDDLTERQKAEMAEYFVRELQTDTWMRALSAADPNAVFDTRPDHQWTGAYSAWPSETARGLYRIGRSELAFRWLKGMARSANQGPFGQAHFADGVVPLEEGGARKAPSDPPLLTDWACSSSGSWVSAIMDGIFGIRTLFGRGLTANPQFASFDPDAIMINVPYHGMLHTVTRNGVVVQT